MVKSKCPNCGTELDVNVQILVPSILAPSIKASAEQNKNAQNKPTIEDVKAEFNKEMLEELKIWETPDGICVKPFSLLEG